MNVNGWEELIAAMKEGNMCRRKTATEIVHEEMGATKRYEQYMMDLMYEEHTLMTIRKVSLDEALRFISVGDPSNALEALRVYDTARG